jgi:hypothetical protein
MVHAAARPKDGLREEIFAQGVEKPWQVLSARHRRPRRRPRIRRRPAETAARFR